MLSTHDPRQRGVCSVPRIAGRPVWRGGRREEGSRREDLFSRQVTIIVLIMIKDFMNLTSNV